MTDLNLGLKLEKTPPVKAENNFLSVSRFGTQPHHTESVIDVDLTLPYGFMQPEKDTIPRKTFLS